MYIVYIIYLYVYKHLIPKFSIHKDEIPVPCIDVSQVLLQAKMSTLKFEQVQSKVSRVIMWQTDRQTDRHFIFCYLKDRNVGPR